MAYVFALIFSVVAFLALPSQAALPPTDQAWVERAEAYLNDLDRFQARFRQTSPDGTQFLGTFSLDRPGKMRFEYDAPIEDYVLADGHFVYFYDSELGQQSNAPIGSTMADFILRDNVGLSGDVEVTDIRETSNGLVLIEVVQAGAPTMGSITFGFSKEPFALRRWQVRDTQGFITEVEFNDINEEILFRPGFFAFRDGRAPNQLNQ